MSFSPAAEPPLRIRLLGSFTIEVRGRALMPEAIGRKRARDILQLLALAPTHRMSRDRLIAALWPEKDAASGANNLHRALHDLRQAIGTGFVHAEKGYVRLGDGVWVDVTEFDALAGSRNQEKLLAALELYRGDLAADDSVSEFVPQRREQLRAAFAEAAMRAAQQAPDHRSAIELLRRVIATDPANEEAHRLLMRRLADAGRRAEAMRQFEECERALGAALDVAPSPQTRQLHEAIARGDAAIPRPQSSGWERVARRLLGSARPPATRGRRDLDAMVREFAQGPSGVLFLVGEAGIGKTHAAVEGARMADAAGAVLFCGAALELESSAPYAPFIEAWSDHLRTAGLGPEENPFLAFSVAPGANPQEDKLRLFQSAQRSLEALAAGRTIYFVVDDLHFADESSLHLFHYLARASRTAPILLLGTCREEELALNAPLHSLVSGIYRERLGKRVVLNRLDREATREIIEDCAGGPVGEEIVQSIYRLTEGNPFFTEEVVHSMRDRPDVPPAPRADLTSLILERVQRLGSGVEQLLTAGAVLGQSFEFDVARRVAGLEQEALDALEVALAARLIEEDEQRYRFRHGLVRESLYTRVSRARRSELHRRAGAALERSAPARTEDRASHLRAAGVRRGALPYLIEAGRRAAARLGLGEAAGFYRQALAAMDELRLEPDERRFKVLLRLGQVEYSLSDLEPAVRELDAAAALVRISDGWRPANGDRAKARRCAALALITAGNLAEANRRLEAAMEDLRAEARSPEYANVLYHLAQLRWHEGRHHDAYAVAEQCLREAERQGDAGAIARGYEILSLSCHSLGEWKSGIEYEERRRALVGGGVDVAQAFDVHL